MNPFETGHNEHYDNVAIAVGSGIAVAMIVAAILVLLR